MKLFRTLLVLLALSTALAHALTFTGTVTNQTVGKPSAGDTVVLVDVQRGMAEAATTTTDLRGRYSIDAPQVGTFLIRVNHQGGSFFIAAPENNSPANINVYDVATKVDGVRIDADMLLLEAAGGTLRVQERYLVRNTSLPPRAQFSNKTFEIVIPEDAQLDGSAATRPGGIATTTRLVPLGQKGHYTFNVPIQPDQGEKETLFEVQYHLPYGGKYTLSPHLQMAADNLVIYAAKGIDFGEPRGATFQPTQEDPRVHTFVAKGIQPGQAISFTISGEGQMPRDAQNGQQTAMGESGSATVGSTGSGFATQEESPGWWSKYVWWIVAPLILLSASATAFILRKRSKPIVPDAPPTKEPPTHNETSLTVPGCFMPAATPVPGFATTTALLGLLKEELFVIESEKLSGSLSLSEYADVKRGLDALLKRTLHQAKDTDFTNGPSARRWISVPASSKD